MEMTLLTGSANPLLAQATAERLGVRACKRDLHRFPDGDLHVEIRESVRGHHVYLIQPTSPPAEGHLFELLRLADAARRAGAARLTAVIPYLGYARQDRRASGREAVGDRFEALFVLALHCGLREGELLGLRWADVDLSGAAATLQDIRGVNDFAIWARRLPFVMRQRKRVRSTP